MKNRHLGKIVLLTFMILAVAGSSSAQIQLRFDPPDTVISLGDDLELSIVLDDSQAVRSFEVWLRYDPDVLTLVDSGPGDAFIESGCQLFAGADEDTIGILHGYVVIMGADCWLSGPGELFVWDFSGSALGISEIIVDNVSLYAPQIGEIENVSLASASVEVSDFQSNAPEPFPSPFLLANCWPNPFNPRTNIHFEISQQSKVNISVFTIDGRKVGELVDEVLPAGQFTTSWDGRDSYGQRVASGTYFYKMLADGFSETKQMVLLK